MRNLLIVESAGKIKKLRSILGSDWDVKASIGHIRQLANDGDGSLGFDMSADTIDCRYIPRDERAKQTIAGLIAAAKQADRVFIASDPDREGEVIGWHIAQVLKLKQPQRVKLTGLSRSAKPTPIKLKQLKVNSHPKSPPPHLSPPRSSKLLERA